MGMATVVGTWRSAPAAGRRDHAGRRGRHRGRQRLRRLRRGRRVRAVPAGDRDRRAEAAAVRHQRRRRVRGRPDLRRHHRPLRRDGWTRTVFPELGEVAHSIETGGAGRRGDLHRGAAPTGSAGGWWSGPTGVRAASARRGSTTPSPTTAAGLLAGGRTGILHYGHDGERRGDELALFVASHAPRPRMLVFGAIDFAAAVARVGRLPRLPGHGLRRPAGLRHPEAVPGRRRGGRRLAAPLPHRRGRRRAASTAVRSSAS